MTKLVLYINCFSLQMLQGVGLKLRTDLHLARRAYHVLGVAFILVIFQLAKRSEAILLISAAVLILIPLDLLRLRYKKINKTALAWFKPFLRNEEIRSFSAMSYLLLGAFFVIVLFPKKIAMLSLIMLAVGDPASSIIGIVYGRDRIVGNKTLQGTLAGFFACTIAAFIFYYFQEIMIERIILVSLITGLIGAFAELIPVPKLDDNFTIPIISATLLWLLFNLFGGFG